MKAGLLWIASLALGVWAASYIENKVVAGFALLFWGLFATTTFILIRDRKVGLPQIESRPPAPSMKQPRSHK